MKITFFKSTAAFLQKDISLSLSISYVVLVAIGIIFNGAYYLCFRVNVIQYSDISDFLLAPFRDFFILIFTIATVAFIYYLNVFDDWLEKNHPKLHHSMYMGIDKVEYQKNYSFKGVLLMIIIYVCFAAIYTANFKQTE